MENNSPSDDWQDVPVEHDDWQDVPAAPQEHNGLYPTADHKMRSPLDVNWLSAAKNELTKKPDPSAKAFLSNPMIQSLGGEAASPLLGAAGKALSGVVGNAAEGIATSPTIPKVGKGIETVGNWIGSKIGPVGYLMPGLVRNAKIAGDVISGVGKSLPAAQKGIGWILDNAPQTLEKFAPVLTKIKQASGAAGLATAHFLLQQSDPQYQEIMKKHQEEQ